MEPGPADVARAADVLRAGGLVAFPTETVYGLGADAENPEALERLFSVKGRPRAHPVIVHLGERAELGDWALAVPTVARRLAAECWPGPLTLVLRRSERVPDGVTGGRETVGLRIPAAPLALALLDEFGGGVAAPSANRFGRVSPTTAAAVRDELGAFVDVVLDGGACAVGVESTIVDCTTDPPAILRLGGVSRARVEAIVGTAVALRDRGEVAAPGTFDRHYSPDLELVVATADEVCSAVQARVDAGLLVVVLAPDGVVGELPPGVELLTAGPDSETYARALYAQLRAAELLGIDAVIAVAPATDDGLGAAVADRLRRGAAPGDPRVTGR